MPQVNPLVQFRGIGDVTITLKPRWRAVLRFVPYFVGGKVEFELKVDNPRDQLRLFQRMGGNPYIQYPEGLNTKMSIKGNIINGEGDIEWRIGVKSDPLDGAPIFTAYALNTDRWLSFFGGLLMGVILSGICQILLSLLKISPLVEIKP